MKNKQDKSMDNREMEENKECFVIMPIGDCMGYENGHFKRVYDLIIKPGIKAAGFEPYRADDNDSSRLIHIDIIKKLIEAPMAICDLTTRNPNVLYELGIRQAFDKPVFIIQEKGTERIFDINGISTVDYEKGFDYEHVISAQNSIKNGIKSTFDNNDDFNSLISLMSINAAMNPTKEGSADISDNSMFKLISTQINNLDKKITELSNEYYKNIKPNDYDNFIIKNNSRISDKQWNDSIKQWNDSVKQWNNSLKENCSRDEQMNSVDFKYEGVPIKNITMEDFIKIKNDFNKSMKNIAKDNAK